MRNRFVGTFLVMLAVLSVAAQAQLEKQPVTVSGDSLAVVKAFFEADLHSRSGPLLFVRSELSKMDHPEGRSCLEGLVFKNHRSGGVQQLPPTLAKGRVRLIDKAQEKELYRRIAEGKLRYILLLSEVVFDDTGRFAVLGRSLYCGSRCATSGSLVFEKIDGKWKSSQRQCGQVVS
jgi:hypothetical protein